MTTEVIKYTFNEANELLYSGDTDTASAIYDILTEYHSYDNHIEIVKREAVVPLYSNLSELLSIYEYSHTAHNLIDEDKLSPHNIQPLSQQNYTDLGGDLKFTKERYLANYLPKFNMPVI